ncbi:hypothetical protein C8F04DRAFT_1403073 [Mycena alexandri]|uniref:Uncharacterized protein n=1 Tax=Mycena alexandri TaxID=1745969 RepID=A0AAD6WNL7_9AGAR|nr:hypothetical protein C8F04DRAFT_1403073 [Mycena alexandri]
MHDVAFPKRPLLYDQCTQLETVRPHLSVNGTDPPPLGSTTAPHPARLNRASRSNAATQAIPPSPPFSASTPGSVTHLAFRKCRPREMLLPLRSRVRAAAALAARSRAGFSHRTLPPRPSFTPSPLSLPLSSAACTARIFAAAAMHNWRLEIETMPLTMVPTTAGTYVVDDAATEKRTRPRIIRSSWARRPPERTSRLSGPPTPALPHRIRARTDPTSPHLLLTAVTHPDRLSAHPALLLSPPASAACSHALRVPASDLVFAPCLVFLLRSLRLVSTAVSALTPRAAPCVRLLPPPPRAFKHASRPIIVNPRSPPPPPPIVPSTILYPLLPSLPLPLLLLLHDTLGSRCADDIESRKAFNIVSAAAFPFRPPSAASFGSRARVAFSGGFTFTTPHTPPHISRAPRKHPLVVVIS